MISGSVLLPVSDVMFTTSGEKEQFAFKPKDDITALESVRISQLFAVANASRIGISWESFVQEHNLWRHFEKRV